MTNYKDVFSLIYKTPNFQASGWIHRIFDKPIDKSIYLDFSLWKGFEWKTINAQPILFLIVLIQFQIEKKYFHLRYIQPYSLLSFDCFYFIYSFLNTTILWTTQQSNCTQYMILFRYFTFTWLQQIVIFIMTIYMRISYVTIMVYYNDFILLLYIICPT